VTRVVAAIIRDAADPPRFFVARRAHGTYAGTWEFPGGKVDGDESDADALSRELEEEGIVNHRTDVQVGPLLSTMVLQAGSVPFEIRHYAVKVKQVRSEPPAKGASHTKFECALWESLREERCYMLAPSMAALVASNQKLEYP
jgi:ADP-ribose pyrophosphatase YjhB (NUDIX family)